MTLLFCVASSGCHDRGPELETTSGRNHQQISSHLNEVLRDVALRQDGRVHFVTRGGQVPGTSPSGATREWDLAMGDSFSVPDHHGTSIYTLKEITASGVVLGYESTFDYRSFGKNLISRDTGQIAIPFRN
jgi:hypothetical protein